MNDTRLPKILLYGELTNAPAYALDVIKRDLKVFSINQDNWEALASDRSNWREATNNGRRDSHSLNNEKSKAQ